jgi:putative nucleotidyltransferase with HDIG domain
MLKKIKVEHVRLGMHIHEMCGPWMDHPFWRSKFVLNDSDDLVRLQESGIGELWIDVAKGLDVAPGESPEEVSAQVDQDLVKVTAELVEELPAQVPLAAEMQRAANICARSKQAVVTMFRELRMGKAISAEAAGQVVEEISNSVMRNPGALISLARLKTADDYTYMHSVAVSALAISLARQLKLDEAAVRDIGIGSLLHDMGKAKTPLNILNKPGKLTNAEFAEMKRHPALGEEVLLASGVSAEIPLDLCRHHHEKLDGSGYPDRLAGDQISLYAKIGAVCDVYDAITSTRPYKPGWDPAESIRKMTEWCRGHFDERVFHAFVKSVGIYPVGSLVRLESGRLAVVIEQSEKSLTTPDVKIIYSTKSQAYVEPQLLSLSTRAANDRIVGREDAEKWGIKNLERFWSV